MDDAAAAARAEVPGLDLGALRAYLDRETPGLVEGELSARVLAGGKSNLTYAVSDASGATVVVRRPPLGHVLATAHDMAREHRVITALHDTAVPVPVTHACCEDEAVIGAPFYVMEHVAGTPYRQASELVALGAERTRAISERMVDTLVDLHAVDPRAVGLEDFGRPEGFLARQVKRWGTQLEGSRSRDLAGADELYAALTRGVPADQPPAIVHGDFRLDNLLVGLVGGEVGRDEVRAVLDWEMATLGDPLTDVGLLVVYQQLARLGAGGDLITDVSEAPGYLPLRELLARYAERSGRDVSDLGFYVGLAYYKLAVILEGIYYRHTQGQTVGAGFAEIGGYVEPLIAGGLRALKEES